jgi:hypothetical protein
VPGRTHHIKSLLGAQRSLAADPAGPFNAHSHDRGGSGLAQ